MKNSLARLSSTLALVAPTATLLATQADAAIFIKFDGVDGEVASKGHEKWIEILSWSWGVSNAGSSSMGSGGGAGKVSLQDFHFSHSIDKASPQLFLACAQGKHIPKATLSFTRSSSSPDGTAGQEVEYYRITLSDVVVSSLQGGTPPPGTTQGGDRPHESISLNFQKIRMEYRTIDSSGQAGQVISAEATISPAR